MLGATCIAPHWARSGNTPSPSWLSCSVDSSNYTLMHRDDISSTAMAVTSEPFLSSWDQTGCPKRTSRRFVVFLCNKCYHSVLYESVCLCRSTGRRCTTTSNHWSNVWRKLLSFLENWWEGSSSSPESRTTKKTLRWATLSQHNIQKTKEFTLYIQLLLYLLLTDKGTC